MPYSLEELCDVGPAAAMPFLVAAADRRATVSYADLARCLGRTVDKRFARSWHHMGNVAGALMDRIIEVAPEAPPLNALVVNRSAIPGKGADWYVRRYLDEPYSRLDVHQKRQAIQAVHDAVWNFKNWRKVGRKAFGREFAPPPRSAGEEDGKLRRLGFRGPAESEEHRRLKEYVAKYPVRFGAPRGCQRGETEKLLDTYDEIDVWFMYPGEELAIEVKSTRSQEWDRRRGIFQCVKYRALLQARSDINKSASVVRTRLVTEVPLSETLKRIARKLHVETQVIKPISEVDL
jgi:hypothetical protein